MPAVGNWHYGGQFTQPPTLGFGPRRLGRGSGPVAAPRRLRNATKVADERIGIGLQVQSPGVGREPSAQRVMQGLVALQPSAKTIVPEVGDFWSPSPPHALDPRSSEPPFIPGLRRSAVNRLKQRRPGGRRQGCATLRHAARNPPVPRQFRRRSNPSRRCGALTQPWCRQCTRRSAAVGCPVVAGSRYVAARFDHSLAGAWRVCP